MTRVFLTDSYSTKPVGARAVLEERARAVRSRLWSDPDDRTEINAELEAIEQELRKLDQRNKGAA